MGRFTSFATLSTDLLKATNLGYPFPPGLNAGHNIAAPPRLFWVLLLVAASLAALACWTLPALADSGDADWSATLVPFGTTAKGCWSTTSLTACSYNLYPDTFVYDDETYRIDRVVLTTREMMYLRLNSTIPGAQSATLVVGSTPLQFDATATKSPRWYDTGIDWSDTDTISLSLWINQEPATPEPVPVNAPPAGADKAITMRANTTYAFAASDFGFSDPDKGDSLSKIRITALQSAGSLKLSGTQVTLNQEVPYHDVTYLVFEPEPDASGSPYATFKFKVSDGETYGSQANTITINVTSVNAPPAGADKTITMRANTTYAFAASDFGFTDPDAGDSLSKIRITALQSAGSLKLGPADLPRVPCDQPWWGACHQNVTRTQVTLNQEIQAAQIGGLVFEPEPDASGSPYATFKFKVSDGEAYGSQANTITINVQPEESAPPDENQQQQTQQQTTDEAPVIVLAGSAGMTLSVNAAYTEPGYTATDQEDGDLTGNVTVTGSVDATQAGTYRLYYDVTDGAGNAAVQQVRTVSVADETESASDPQAGLSEVVKRYDADGNGAIDDQEWATAMADYADGILTSSDIYAISAARS